METARRKKPTFKFRYKLLVYPKFQLTLLGANTIVLGGIYALVATQTFRFFHELRETGMSIKLAADHPYFRFVDMESGKMSSYLLIAFLVGMLISSIASLWLSQRLAGPIVRMRGFFQKIHQGQADEELKFRKGDFFGELPGVVNQALRSLRKNQKK